MGASERREDGAWGDGEVSQRDEPIETGTLDSLQIEDHPRLSAWVL